MKKTAQKRLTRKEIMRLKRRRRERRMYILTAVLATFCVFAIIGVIVLLDKNSETPDTGDWIAAGSGADLATPAAAATVLATVPATPEVTPEPVVTPEPTAETSAEPSAEPTAEPTADAGMPSLETEDERRIITISAAGDFTLGGDYNTSNHERFDGYADKYGVDYFMQHVRYIFEADDLTFVNLEGPLTTGNDKRSGRQFNFKGSPEYAKVLSGSSIELAGLANNHALDYGKEGLLDTAENLEAVGVGVCGYSTIWYDEINGIRVGCLSVTEWDYSTEELAEMVAEADANSDLVIVMIHWGEEKGYEPTKSQKKYGRALIDAGADLVLGSHPHVLSGLELYNGKYIVYSLGNFCFGGHKNPSDHDTMIFQQSFELLPDGTIVDAGVNIIPCYISSSADTNDYCPIPVDDESEATRIIRKISIYSDVDMDLAVWTPEMQKYFSK